MPGLAMRLFSFWKNRLFVHGFAVGASAG